MKVKFSPDTKDDFRNYKEYLKKLKDSDSNRYHHISPEESKKKLRGSISSSIGNKNDHFDSIFQKTLIMVVIVIKCLLIKRVIM